MSKYMILYFDVLGYKYHVEREQETEFFQRIKNSFEQAMETLHKLSDSDEKLEFRIFSDNMLVAIKQEDNSNPFQSLCSFACYIQAILLIFHNIAIRGSISAGDLILEEHFVYGKGLVHAYELENDFAKYPRIIIDSDLPEENIKQCNDMFLHHDVDGYWITNYLGYGRESESEETNNVALSLHRGRITKALADSENNAPVHVKYVWCREYHNRICEQLDLHNVRILP